MVIKKPVAISLVLLTGAMALLQVRVTRWLGLERDWVVAGDYAAPAVAGASTVRPAPDGWQKIKPETYSALVTETTADAVLSRLNIATDPADYVKTDLNLAWGVGGQVYLYRAPVITVVDGKKEQSIHSWATTVGALLAEVQIDLGDQDKVEPVGETVIDPTNPPKVVITRVQETDVRVPEKIAFAEVKQNDSTLEKNTTKVTQVGVNGVRTKTYHVRRENGEEVSRVLIKNEVTTAPKDQITKVGTRVVVYGTGSATWYTKSLNHVAAHNTLPKGTRVKVVNTANNKSTVVTVVGGGLDGAAIDLSYDAFAEIGDPGKGRVAVRLEKVYD